MSEPIRITATRDDLRQPILIAAFEGWNDAGEAASGALEALVEITGAETFADIELCSNGYDGEAGTADDLCPELDFIYFQF